MKIGSSASQTSSDTRMLILPLLFLCSLRWVVVRTVIIDYNKTVVKPDTVTPLLQGSVLAGTLARVHLLSHDNQHAITSWFQLEEDTDPDSCMLKSLHLRIPYFYLMWTRLRQTWLVLWQTATGHGFKLALESIFCVWNDEKRWEFWFDKRHWG